MPWLSPLPFSECSFEESQRGNEDLIWERNLMSEILPFLCGNTDIPNRQHVLFDGLQAMVPDVVPPQPAFYDGALPTEIDQRMKDDLGHFIIPSAANAQFPAVPNFFLEFKAPNEDANVVKRKACYDGAFGARAMHQLQIYRGEPFYDNTTHTITSTYDPDTGVLEFYVTHPTRPTDPRISPEYHMTQLGSYALKSNVEEYRRGVTAFRNARDWAKEQRDRFIEKANAKAREFTLLHKAATEKDGADEGDDGEKASEAEDNSKEAESISGTLAGVIRSS